MKRQVSKNVQKFLHRTKKELVWTLIPALLWLGATYSRSWVIHPKCTESPTSCSKESVLKVDQFSLGIEDGKADEFSYFTQNLSGVVALAVPASWSLSQLALGRVSGAVALATIGIDFFTVAQVASWNGLFTELSHLISQRPRPFVYSDPQSRGIDTAHYTSFYSGHTSFAAVATSTAFLILFKRRAPWYVLAAFFAIAETLVFSTAYFRILAGRHFFSDVMTGAIAGALVAWAFSFWNRNKELKL
jgi:membrane-associated phospholipid phosphatase